MITVHKFRLEYPGVPSIVKMDPLGVPLCVSMQGSTIQMWAEVDPNVAKVERVFHVYETGVPIQENDEWIDTLTKEDEFGFQSALHLYEAR